MSLSGRTTSRVVAGFVTSTALAGATLLGAASSAFAQPNPAQPQPAQPNPAQPQPAQPDPAQPSGPPAPNCTAGDLAQVSGSVGTAMAAYLFAHPDVNNFFTSLRGKPDTEIHDDVQNYMNANPQVQHDINGIRQPLTDLRNRCQ